MKLIGWVVAFFYLVYAIEAFGHYQTGLSGESLIEPEGKEFKQSNSFHNSDIVWAVNVGGGEYVGLDSIHYQAEQYVNGGTQGEIDKILGSQDSVLYQSYREGDFSIDYPIENGEYILVFHFAEPFDIEMDGRLFNVIAQDQTVINDLSVRLARDGKHKSGLVTAVSNVKVTEGRLKIRFEASAGKPILNALVVRKSNEDNREKAFYVVLIKVRCNIGKYPLKIAIGGQVFNKPKEFMLRLKGFPHRVIHASGHIRMTNDIVWLAEQLTFGKVGNPHKVSVCVSQVAA